MISIRKIARNANVSPRALTSLLRGMDPKDAPVFEKQGRLYATDEDELLDYLEHEGFVIGEDLPSEEDEDDDLDLDEE